MRHVRAEGNPVSGLISAGGSCRPPASRLISTRWAAASSTAPAGSPPNARSAPGPSSRRPQSVWPTDAISGLAERERSSSARAAAHRGRVHSGRSRRRQRRRIAVVAPASQSRQHRAGEQGVGRKWFLRPLRGDWSWTFALAGNRRPEQRAGRVFIGLGDELEAPAPDHPGEEPTRLRANGASVGRGLREQRRGCRASFPIREGGVEAWEIG